MATPKAARRTVSLHIEQEADSEFSESLPEAAATADYDGDASLCPACGEPLTWHEQPCAAAHPDGAASGPAAETEAEPDTPPPPAGGFAYAVGHLVVPATQQQAHPVVWRGQLRERSAATGLVYRINVYRLGDGYWDCYREEELRAA